MQVREQNLTSRDQTGREMYKICRRYWQDLGNSLDTTLSGFFDKVRKIPYQQDSASAEVLSRPKYSLNPQSGVGRYTMGEPGALDCKKKAILMGSWLEGHGIPYRFVAVSETPNGVPHHVFTQAKIGGEWKNVDPTYPEYALFEPKPGVTNAVELLP